jgi:hypothetical protein
MAAERLGIPVILILVCAAMLYCGAQIFNILAPTFEQAVAQSEPIVDPVIEEIPVYEEVQAIEQMPIVTQEALAEPVIEQSVAAADTVTPGTTFGNIKLPPVDITQSHAEEHAEFPIVRQCYENPNNIMMYRERHNAAYKWMYHILCQSKEDGKWYDRLIYKIQNVWYEETGFMPKDGSWDQVSKWLQRKGVERIRQLP